MLTLNTAYVTHTHCIVSVFIPDSTSYVFHTTTVVNNSCMSLKVYLGHYMC